MIKGTVVRDDSVWQGHPDVALFNGTVYVCYRESSVHLAPSDTKIFVTKASQDFLNKWTKPEEIASGNRFNCPRLSVHNGRLWLVCDVIPGGPDFLASECSQNTRIWIWSSDNGKDWVGPIKTNIQGIVPDRLFFSPYGDFLIAAHTKKYILKRTQESVNNQEKYDKGEVSGRLIQNIWRSSSVGDNWEGPIKVADILGYNFCEASLFDIKNGIIGCMMRENSRRGDPAYYMLSSDGYSWSGPYKTRMFGCHRPVIGRLKSGRWLTTYREQCNSVYKNFWAKNTFACLSEPDGWNIDKSFCHSITLPIDHDSSKISDSGYTGWTQLDDKSILIVNYITDDAPKPYIRYYVLDENEF